MPFRLIEYIYETECIFVTILSANVLVLVVGSISTGTAFHAKLPLAWAYLPKLCIISSAFIDNDI